MSPAYNALAVAVVAALGYIGSAWVSSRSTQKTTAQSAAALALEQVWNQRVMFRDEQIADLRQEIADQAAAHTKQIERLSAQVQRLSDQVVELGGIPHES